MSPSSRTESQIYNNEEEIKKYYKKSTAKLETNIPQQNSAIKLLYKTENNVIGLRKPVCSVIDQFIKKNKRLDMKST